MSSATQTDESSQHIPWLERIGSLLGLSIKVRGQESLREMLEEAEQVDNPDLQALEMMRGVLDVVEMQARDIMIPRSQMAVLERDQSLETLLPIVIETAHSRFPVVGDNRDEVIGILLAKDLLGYLTRQESSGSFNIKDLVRPAMIIPESKRLNTLLREFRYTRNHMAIVVDEYGGVSGLITIEDVLEQIVGDIEDEHDLEEEDDERNIQRLEGGEVLVSALTPIDDFNNFFGTQYSDDEFNTIGGVVMNHCGRMPKKGEKITLRPLSVVVEEADRRRIYKLRICQSELER
ncbi:CBS domain-containing protein [Ectothiorhodospiraceae bacterium BW-2]|nr:CBS domain-containing protein [Ectothiorhodospiraceae bacterium BW-2]